jgi:tRNA-2-methylthio-N6-dimethylallyladenosine synthase
MANPVPKPRTIFLETFGCQMNVLDSELVESQLRALGYRFTDNREAADVALFNTCSVRQHAEDKVHARIGDFKPIKKRRPDIIVGVLGCMAERDGEALLGQYPQLDLVCGPGELDKVPLLIANAHATHQPQKALQGNTNRRSGTLSAAADQLEMLDLGRSFSPDRIKQAAYVRITRGCNKFCTYCVVPFTRGAEVHRPPDHIIDECKRLADAGALEITLLGQTVNHYRYDHAAAGVDGAGPAAPQIGPGLAVHRQVEAAGEVTTFAKLLQRVHDEVPAIRRLRFVTSYPLHFGDDVLAVMRDCARICRYLHVPAQSGSDRMLKAMNRGYTVDDYRRFIERCRSYLPDVMIASDFIVGFPGETDADFAQTVDLLRWARFKNSFIFKYSPRPGTAAYDRLPDDVSDEVKRQRNMELLNVQAEVSGAVHAEQVGRTFDVLVEGVSAVERKKRAAGSVELGWDTQADAEPRTQLSARTPGDLIVMFDGDERLVGQIAPVKITRAKPLALFGELVPEPSAV